MPLNDYRCGMCNKTKEIFTKSRSGESEIFCDNCHSVMTKAFPLTAKMPSAWNSGWNKGLDGQGFMSKALGTKVHSKREEERIMAAKGFVPESDLGRHFIDDMIEKKAAEKAAGDAETQRYVDNLAKFGGNKELAVVETWPAKEMLAQAD